jgi:hypothetical protein
MMGRRSNEAIDEITDTISIREPCVPFEEFKIPLKFSHVLRISDVAHCSWLDTRVMQCWNVLGDGTSVRR